ncbi:alpha/beta fold hydrolase [[Mycoplasma] mobile]|uniref:Lysophospholipase n=1 Tax=Mycoplasma mobile (strain ATCC 43663 / 163K / NCTC 11711) TaxID=267748 RepID=Q6KHQ7_MYCM1|nr:alpha/beta fold hydrolase [[Mycoplasma] mobile]AAT27871.1 lysophospholipase [Mycoplasma mobile 163K]
MIETIINTNSKTIPIIKNEIDTEKVLIYFHGLGGTAKDSKFIFEHIKDYTTIVVKQRGHENNINLKASRYFKEYLKDIFDVILYYKKMSKKIFLLGESMGAAFSSLISYYFKDAVEAVFACSIPDKLTNIFLDSKKKKFVINFRTIATYFFNINYKFQARIDFHKISNNKVLQRLTKLDVNTQISQTRNIIASWNAIRTFWKIAKRAKSNSPIYFFYGSDDILIKQNKIENKLTKIKFFNENFHTIKIENSKHVLLLEGTSNIIFDKINEVLNPN